ncbi:pyridoxamine 5'-phosphate oxidase family protein [Pseudoruegeria sp. SK021]|uniref:pyridoxamine 5'-phosphate oxidase family protein n=1 Tax=Pseudoruegeria sp. SK021 TaxID=1933035 RepID=UPI000A225E21|nr:pyridoxamine 5'-phosphate oxidase family protein [Pseudoruegeria sp. SK021]OSP54525.1 hypothetical protein BV911_12385 [Pseudoruegeria sp. SK021]
MTDWWAELGQLQDRFWTCLCDGAAGRHPAARFLALATAGQTGGAEARMVVLRGADRGNGSLTVHTDTLSAKVSELRADPRASLLFWDPDLRLQVRLKVEVGIDTGQVVDADWQRVPEPARRVYGILPPPGADLTAPVDLATLPDRSRFAVMTCTITRIDALHLGRTTHRRAMFRRSDDWIGQWIAP